MGIWSSHKLDTENAEWHPVNDGLGNVRVDMLRIRKSDNMVVAASHGRGLFTAKYDKVISTSINNNEYVKLNSYPNPCTNFININLNSGNSSDVIIKLSDIAGKCVYSSTKKGMSGSQTIRIDVSKFAKGTYILNVQNGNKNYTDKVIKN